MIALAMQVSRRCEELESIAVREHCRNTTFWQSRMTRAGRAAPVPDLVDVMELAKAIRAPISGGGQ